MVVCKFFLQGNCRYGDRCWNEHPRGGQVPGDQSYGFGGRQQAGKPIWGGGGNRFSSLQNQPQQQGAQSNTNANSTPQELLQLIAEDAGLWGQSKMWPFSCYRVRKDGPTIPGFEDLSQEELRLEAYTAEKSGTFQAYLQKVSGMAAEYGKKRDALQQQSMDTKQNLLQLIQSQEKQTASSSTSLFGGQHGGTSSSGSSSGGLFGQNQTGTPSLFGQASQQNAPSVFGGQSANTGGMFGQGQGNTAGAFTPPSGSVFGGQTQTENKGLFGKPAALSPNPPTGAVFGQPAFANQTQQPSGGLFGKPLQAQQPPIGGGLFGKGPAQNQTGAVFGGLFGKGPAQNQTGAVFDTNQQQQVGCIFSAPQNQQPPQQMQSVFGSSQNQPQTSVFGQPGAVQPPTGLFGKPAIQPSSDPHANLFKPATQQQNPMTQNQVGVVTQQPQQTPQQTVSNQNPVSSIYTAPERLSKDDKEQFEAAKFTLGKIPMCPPPAELI